MKFEILTLAILTFSFISTLQGQVKQITSEEAEKIMRTEKSIVVLDVRTADEFEQGHLTGAINIDITQQDAYKKIDELNPDAIYLVYCRTNRRSAVAANHMSQKRFKHIYQIMDGFIGWKTNSLPLSKL